MPAVPAPVLGISPPDGGWGWIVVFGSFISIGFSFALPKALTVFFTDIQQCFQVSSSEIAWLSSIMLAVMFAGGPISSMLVNRYGSRPVVMVGGVLIGFAMVTASFGTSITHLYICVGVIGGLGLSLNLQPSLTIIGKYFLVKRPLATGIAMAGSPVFLSTLAPFGQFLNERYGWRGSFLVLGGLTLNCCVAGALMRPLRDLPPPGGGATQPNSPPDSPGANAAQDKKKKQTEEVVENGHSTQLDEGCAATVSKALDLTLLKHKGFLIYMVTNMLMFFAIYSPMVFLASFAVSKGVDERSAALLLTVVGLVDMFVRPGTGFVANTKLLRPRIQYLFSFAVVFNGACHLLCPLASGYGYGGLVGYAVAFAVAFGMMFALMFESLMDLVGPERFSSAMGLATIMESCPMLLGPPLAGALVDMGDYNYLYLTCGGILVTAGLLFLVMIIFYYRFLDRERSRGPGQVKYPPQPPGESPQLGMKEGGPPSTPVSGGPVQAEEAAGFEDPTGTAGRQREAQTSST